MDSKLLHESFVSDNNGTTIADINLVTLVSNLSLLAYLFLSACLSSCLFLQRPVQNFLFQFTILILPSLLSTTIFSDHLIPFLIFLFLVSITAYIIYVLNNGGFGDGSQDEKVSILSYHKKFSIPPSTSLLPIPKDENKLLPSEKTLNSPTSTQENLKLRSTTQGVSAPTGNKDRNKYKNDLTNPLKSSKNPTTPPYRPSFISNARAFVLLQTSISILAVDFPVYPRRYGKTENTGFGLMDACVGLFIVCNSVVDPVVRRPPRVSHDFLQVFRTITSSILSTWPLLCCFVVRLVSVKSLDYHEHLTEYGVHWNFFLTLACLKVLSNTTSTLTNPRRNLFIAIFISIFYEIYLEHFRLKDYVLSPGPRITIIDMNKEGLFSLSGNYCLYVYALALGRFIYQHHCSCSNTSQSDLHSKRSLSIKLMCLSVCLWLSLYMYLWLGLHVSRRTANTGYVLWVLAICTLVLSLSLLVEVVAALLIKKETLEVIGGFEPSMFRSSTHNSFFFFLIANLFTGLVNMTLDTINTNTVGAMTVLVGYLGGLNGVFMGLYAYGVRLKFW